MKERLKKDKKLRRNIIVRGCMVFTLLIASCYTLFIKPNLSQETYVYKEETVERGDLILGIMESGSVTLGECSILYELDLDTEDDAEEEDDSEEEEEEGIQYLEIESVYAVSGQRLKEGDALFQFTEKSVKAVRRKLSAAQAQAQIALSEAQTDYNISLLSAKSNYHSSTIAGTRASSDYQAALSQSKESVTSLEAEIKVLQHEITKAQEMLADEDFLESYNDAKTSCTQAKNKYDETDLHNSTAYTSNLSAYESAKSTLEQIEEEIEGYQDTIVNNQAEIERIRLKIETAKANQVVANQEAGNQYDSAILEGELAEDIYNYTVDSLSDTVSSAQTDYDEITEKITAFEAFVGEDNIVYADGDGLVTSVAYSEGDDLITTGAMLTYAKENEYNVSIDVSEEDVAAIKVGDSVDLVFTAYPALTYEGTIISITTSATTEYASTISYPVTIKVEGDTTFLYGGMTADVTFITDSVSDVLYVSRKAVFEENGISYVYRQTKSGGMEKTEVETGFSDTADIEIISGLEEGDVVYIESIMNVNADNRDTEEENNRENITSEDGTSLEDDMIPGGNSERNTPNEGEGGFSPDHMGSFPSDMGGRQQ